MIFDLKPDDGPDLLEQMDNWWEGQFKENSSHEMSTKIKAMAIDSFDDAQKAKALDAYFSSNPDLEDLRVSLERYIHIRINGGKVKD